MEIRINGWIKKTNKYNKSIILFRSKRYDLLIIIKYMLIRNFEHKKYFWIIIIRNLKSF